MLQPLRSQIGPLIAVLVGVGVLIFALQLFAFGSQPVSTYAVDSQPLTETEVDDRVQGPHEREDRYDAVFAYDDLSPAGQEAFLAAYRSADDRVTYRGAGYRVPEFDYPGDYSNVGFGEYYVRYQGDYYELRTMGPGPLSGLGSFMITLVLGFVGTTIAIVGVALTDRRTAASAFLGLAVFAGLYLSEFGWLGADRPATLAAIGYLTFLLPAIATRALLERRASASSPSQE